MTRRRWWLIGGGAALVIAVVAGVIIWQAASRPASAEETATAYLRALESGDAGAIEATGIEVSAAALDAFAGATGLIEDAEVSAVDEDETAATADVAFRLGGEDRKAQLTLSSTDGRWTVDASGLGAMTATATLGAFVGVGEQTFPVGEAVGLLPADYTVSAAPAPLLEGETPLAVLPGESADVAVDVTLRPEATDAAQKQLDAHLDTCIVPAATPPPGCGIRIPWGTEFRVVADIRYRIEQPPVIALTATGFSADGGVLVATVTGTGQDGAARTTTYRTDSWSVRGDIAFTADGLELTPW